MLNFLFVGAGGFIGCCARYGITLLFPTAMFPHATLISNVFAGFLMGIYMGLDKESFFKNESLVLFLRTGLLGGLSTFSTFNMETINLFQKGEYIHAGGNVILNLTMTFLAVAIGIFLVKMIFQNR